MRKDQGNGVVSNRFPKNFGYADKNRVGRTPIDHDFMRHAVFCIQEEHPEFFLLELLKGYKDALNQVVGCISRCANHNLLLHFSHKAARVTGLVSQLERCSPMGGS